MAALPARHYEHEAIGYNYRMSNLLEAEGRAQLADLDRRVAARRGIERAVVEHEVIERAVEVLLVRARLAA